MSEKPRGLKSLRNPRPRFICDLCGWQTVALVRQKLGWDENKPYAVEGLGDPRLFYISRNGKVHSHVHRCFDEHAEADLYGHKLHINGIHYRVTKYDPTID